MKEQPTVYEEDEMVEVSIAYPSDNDEYYLISDKAFEHSPENIKEGQTDILMFFCGIISTVLFFSVLLTALNDRMTFGSALLLILYAVMAVVCFVSPIQVFISHKIWNANFSKKLIVNAGAGDKVMLSEKAFYYTDPEGVDIRVPYNDMYGLYCVGDFLIFEIEKKKICAMRLDSVSDEKVIKSLRQQVEECMLHTESLPEELMERDENGFVIRPVSADVPEGEEISEEDSADPDYEEEAGEDTSEEYTDETEESALDENESEEELEYDEASSEADAGESAEEYMKSSEE